MFGANLSDWLGRKVIDLRHSTVPENVPGNPIFRIRYDYSDGDSFVSLLERLADSPHSLDTTGIVVGLPGEPYTENGCFEWAATQLIERKDKFPKLRALFWGDFTYEENEVSWAEQTDASRLLDAFPGLEHFVIRGAGIRFSPVRHICLQSLVFQTGGLSSAVFQSLEESVLPELKKLHFMTGDSGYGWDGTPGLINQFLKNLPFPAVTDLGILNAERGDDVVKQIIDSGVLDQLDRLDLSEGTVGDIGARRLLDSGKLSGLEALTINRHYIGEALQQELRDGECENLILDGYEGDEPPDQRYVATGE